MRGALLAALALLVVAPVAYGSKEAGDRTITKVIKLLQGMLEKSKEDGDADTELFAKYKCYCDTNAASKTKAIDDANKAIKVLSGEIEELTASNGELSSENAQLQMDMQSNEAAREQATSLRERASTDFKEEEADMKAAIGQMGQAIETLSAIDADKSASLIADRKFMRKAAPKNLGLLKLKSNIAATVKAATLFLPQKDMKALESFIQAPFAGTYTAQSGEIVGILKTMRDTFKENLVSAQNAEKSSQEAYDQLMAVQTEQHDKMKDTFEDKEKLLGDNDDALSTKKATKSETLITVDDDEGFLAKLTALCAAKTKAYEDRKVVRAGEEAAVAQAISILNSDAAFDTFGTTKATTEGFSGFIQLRLRTVRKTARELMAKQLARAARDTKSLRLAKVAALLEDGNPFDKVTGAVEEMIALIQKEEAQDHEQLDWCNSERESNEATRKDKQGMMDSLDEKKAELVDIIDNEETGLKKLLADDQASLAENQKDQADETEDRAAENAAYQKNVHNLVEAQSVIKKARKVLTTFYDSLKAKKDAFLQRSSKEDPAPPEGDFSEHGGEAGSEATSLLSTILEETEAEEKSAHDTEDESKKEFDETIGDLKKKEGRLLESITDLSDRLAEKEKTLAETKEDLAKTTKEHKAIEKYLIKIKPGCDFITENIDTRDEHRKNEVKALQGAEDTLKETPVYKKAAAKAEKEDAEAKK